MQKKPSNIGSVNFKSNNSKCHCFHSFTFRLVINLAIRTLCTIHALFLMYFCYDNICKNKLVFLPSIASFLMVCEGIYVIFYFDGKESKWFSWCMFFYILSVIPSFWIMEFMTTKEYVRFFRWTFAYTDVTKILQQTFYIITIVLRWVLPKYKNTREQMSNVIKFLLNIASDAQELQSNVTELRLQKDLETLLTFEASRLYLFTWTWSLPLFCVNIDETLEDNVILVDDKRNNKKDLQDESNYYVDQARKISEEKFIKLESKYLYTLFQNFYWKFTFIIFLIDLPYLIIRLISRFTMQGLPLDIDFFIAKNSIQVILGLHRVLCRLMCPERDEEEDENELKNKENEIDLFYNFKANFENNQTLNNMNSNKNYNDLNKSYSNRQINNNNYSLQRFVTANNSVDNLKNVPKN